MLAIIIVIAVAGIIGNARGAASGNNPSVCSYTVDIAGFAPGCIPLKVQTRWNCGGIIRTVSKGYTANGIIVEALNPGGNPPCPPACDFVWASLNGGATMTTIGGSNQYTLGNCCYIMSVSLDALGGVYIKIRPCK
jgi:hypothetical protein